MAKWIVVLIGLGCMVFVVVVVYAGREVIANERTITVARTQIDRSARGQARVESVNHPAKLGFPFSGVLKSVKVKEGDSVSQGAVLAELDSTPLDLEVDVAQAALKEAKAKLALLRAKPQADLLRQLEERVKRATAEVEAAQARLQELIKPSPPPTTPAWQVERARLEVELAALQQNEAAYNQKTVFNSPTDDQKAIGLAHVNVAQAAHEAAKRKVEAGNKEGWPGTYGKMPGWQRADVEGSVEQTSRQVELAQAQFDQVKHGASADEKNAAKARAEAATKRWELAKEAYQRLQEPPPLPPASAHQIELARLEVAKAESAQREAAAALAQVKADPRAEEVESVLAGIERAEKTLAQALAQKEAAVIRAPFDGSVTGRFYEPGAVPPPSAPVVEVADNKHKRVRAELDALWSGELEVGQPVTFSGNVLAGGDLGGKIERIIDEVGPKTLFSKDPTEPKGGEVVVLIVNLDEPKSDDEKLSFKALRPGLRLDLKVNFEKRDNVLAIPRSYVDWRDGKYLVYKYESDGANSRRSSQEVVLGFRDGVNVEVTAGLTEGDKIVKPQPEGP
ncbi:MAG: HlyD family efflux transporter periplasmic adaptor subunit [Planctomycetota bacterium]|nr:HlyD family efflux transporter periplasmic adaptor subunit [Planctomycetota bacterium]